MGEDRSVPGPDARLGDILIREGLARPADVEDCLSTLSSLRASGAATPPTLGELLVKKGCLTPEQWEATVRLSQRENLKAGATPATTPGLPPSPLPAPDSGFERRYGVVGEIGRGGMGLILDAKDLRIHRELAIKVHLRGDDVDPEEFAKFLQEAQVQGQLEHPNICPVHELGTDAQGRPYFTMKKVKGRSLAEVLELLQREPGGGEARTFTLSRLLDIFCKICDAVAFAHSRGVIHRDLKPQNIMIGEFGEVLVMDWGLAKILGTKDTRRVVADRLEEGAQASMDGDVMGTPTYMPPEQAQGRVGEIDARSDVYALGGILYAILTLQAPLQGSSRAEVMERARHAEVVPPSQRAPERGIPADLEAAAMKALRYRREDRYGDVPAFKADITAFLEGRTLAAAAYTPLQVLSKWVRRNRVFALTASAAAVLLLVATVVYVRGVTRERSVAQREAERARAAEGDARNQSAVAQSERGKAEEAARKATAESARAQGAEAQARRHSGLADASRLEAERRLAESLVSQGDALIFDKRFKQARSCYRQARELLTQVGAPTQTADLGLMDVALQTHPPLMTLPLKNTHIYFLAILPGDQGLRGEHGQVVLWDLRTGRDLKVIKTDTFSSGVVSPDSRRVLLGGNKEIAVWDLASGAKVRSFPAHAGWVTELAPSPDGGRVLSYAKEDGLKLWDLERGVPAPGSTPWASKTPLGQVASRFMDDPIQSLAWSPDGNRAAWGTKTRMTILWDMTKNEAIETSSSHGNYVNSVTFSPDDRRLLTGSGDNTIRIWDASTGDVIRTLQGHTNYVEAALWTPDGRRVLSASSDHTLRLWDAESGQELRRFTDHERGVELLAVSPDGRLALSAGADSTLKLWDLGAECRDRDFRVHLPHAGIVRSAAYSKDGTRLVSTGEDGALRLWDAGTGRELRTLRAQKGWVSGLEFSADHSKLLVVKRGIVHVLSLESGLEVQSFRGHSDYVFCVALSQDGHRALSGGNEALIRLWDTTTGKEIRTFPGSGATLAVRFSTDGKRAIAGGKLAVKAWSIESGQQEWSEAAQDVAALAFSPDGRHVACGSSGVVFLLDQESGRRVASFPHAEPRIHGLAFSRNGTGIVASADTTLLEWDIPSGRLLRSHRRTGSRLGLFLSPDGRQFAERGDDESLRLVDLETERTLRPLATHEVHTSTASAPNDLSMSGDGSLVLSCSGASGTTLWDVDTGRALHTWTGWINTAALSADGTRVVIGNADRSLETWNLKDLNLPHLVARPKTTVFRLALDRIGKLALVADHADEIQLWSLEESRLLRTVGRHQSRVNGMSMDPDGRVAASGDEDGKLKVWDLEAGAEIDLKGHDGWISSTAFLPGATRLLSGSGDRSLRLWDARKGHETRGYPEHLESVTSIAVSASGRTAVLGTRSNVIRIWDVESWRELRTFGGHTGYINKVAVSADGGTALSASDDRSIRRWDFSIARRLQDFEDRVAAAVATLRLKRDDAAAMASLGEWYCHRGIVSWGLDFLERARRGGATVASLALARAHWELGDLEAARRHFQESLELGEAPEPYLRLCLHSLEPPKTVQPEPRPAPSPTPPPTPAPGGPYIGIQPDTTRDPAVEGAPLANVIPGKPAEAAGLRAGDVITHFAGKAIQGFEDLRKAIQASKVGDRVDIRYLRNGVPATAQCEVGRFAPETPPK